MAKKLTKAKAREILHDKEVHGQPLTDKQRRFFGAIAGGAEPYKAENGIEGTMGGLTDKGFNFNPAWGGAWKNGGELLHAQKGEKVCPPGFVNIDGKCFDRGSKEYKDLYEEGIGYLDKTGTLVSSKMELPEVVVKPESVLNFLDKTIGTTGGSSARYAFDQLGKQYGFPEVKSQKEYKKNNPLSFFSLPKAKGHYWDNTIYADDIKNYLAELAHHNMFKEKGRVNQIGRWIGNDLIDYVTGNDPYKTEGDIEYEAHKIVEPKLKEEYIKHRNKYLLDKYGIYGSSGIGIYKQGGWLDKYQDGGKSNQASETEMILPEVVVSNKEKVLRHTPSASGNYQLTKTVTPFKTNRQIRKGVEAPLYPNEVNFISNYAGAIGSVGSVDSLPSAVPFEGEKHWNIDRFIMDPAFSEEYPNLRSGQSKKGLKKNVLADMYKYYMLQGQDKDDAFRSAKQFMRQEINPRLNSKYFKEASRLTGVHNQPITEFANQNPFIDLRNINEDESLRSNPFYKEYFENPITEREMKQISKSYLKNFKKMSGKESRKKVKEWIKEANAPEVRFQPSGISMGQEDYRDGGNLMPPMAGADQTVPMYAMGGSLPGSVGFMYARTAGAAPSEGPYAKKTLPSAQNGAEMAFYQQGLDWKPKTISRNGGWLDKFDDEVPQAQTGFLTQRYSTGPMMGDLATQSGVPTQGEVARQDQLRKEVEAAKQKQAARARYEAMPKIGPAKQRNYSEQVQADERRRRLNKEYIADKPHLRLDSKGNIINTNPELTLEGQSIPYTSAAKAEKFARSWETPLAVEGALSLAPLVGRGAVAASEYLTTQTPLRNAYKINPWAFKPKSTLNYRQVGEKAFEDLERTGLVRGAGENIITDPNKNLQQVLDYYSAIEKGTPNMSGAMNIKAPYFQRGNLFYDVNSPEAKYLIETTQSGTGVFSPAQSGFVFKGEGFYPSNAPGGIGVLNPSVFDRELANFNIYKRDWLRGYKPVKFSKPISTTSVVRGPIPPPYPGNVINVGALGRNVVGEELPERLKPILMDETGVISMEDALIKRLPPPVPTAEELALSQRLKDRNRRVIEALKNRKQKKEEGGEIVKDNEGYWNPQNWGKPVEISSNKITMEGVLEPLLGVSDTGDTKMMYPGKNYTFDGTKVVEYPREHFRAEDGKSVNRADEYPLEKLDNLLNFTNYNKPKAKSGKWLEKYK